MFGEILGCFGVAPPPEAISGWRSSAVMAAADGWRREKRETVGGRGGVGILRKWGSGVRFGQLNIKELWGSGPLDQNNPTVGVKMTKTTSFYIRTGLVYLGWSILGAILGLGVIGPGPILIL